MKGKMLMSRIAIPALDEADKASRPTLDAVHKQFGVVPNLYRLIGISPAALTAFTSFQGAMSKSLDVKTRGRIAIAVAQVNRCGYCLSAHTYLGLNLAKIPLEEIAMNRKGGSSDAKANVAVAFAYKVAQERGHVSATALAAVRKAGYTDAQIVEIVALVAENTFTNYLNEVAKTDIDFPVIEADEAA
jgi:uncharacterized peroxidase-related enzyme